MATSRICSIPDCGKPMHAHGYCGAHYARYLKGSPIEGAPVRRFAPGAICEIDGCGRPTLARGLCIRHYKAFKRHGDPLQRRAGGQGDAAAWLVSHVGYDRDDCLTWPFARDPAGYGDTRFRGKTDGAHRVMCILAHGDPPSKMHYAVHSCGKGHLGCVNPRHLRWATPSENMEDAKRHGTFAYGPSMPHAKLSEQAVREIRLMYWHRHMTQREIAEIFDVHRVTVSQVLRGKRWAWVT